MNRSFTLTRAAGLDRLAAVMPRLGRIYAAERNADPGPDAETATTALSPYLRRRLITEEEVVAAAHALGARRGVLPAPPDRPPRVGSPSSLVEG